MAKKLTTKQEKFCLAYIETGNASEAYRRAYNTKKMKPETINNKAYELLKKGDITARVEQLRAEVQKRTEVTIDRVVKELARVAFVDPKIIFNEDGSLKSLSEIDSETTRAISEITVNTTKGEEIIKYKFNDKNRALDMLMKHLGGYDKDNLQKITSIVVRIEE